MKKIISILILSAISISPIFAGESKGIIDEFMEVEDFLSKKKPSPEFRKKMLERNLLDSLKNTLSRKFSNPKEDLKELKIDSISYERQQNTYKIYIKYEEFYIFYEFAMDPEIYLQLPQAEILYLKPANYDKEKPHKESDTVMPDPKN